MNCLVQIRANGVILLLVALAAYSAQSGAITVTLNPDNFPGADLGAKVDAAASSPTCIHGCILAIPSGSYALKTAILIHTISVKIQGANVTLIGTNTLDQMMNLSGDGDEVNGLNFNLDGSTYGVVLDGKNQSVIGNRFSGHGGLYVKLSGALSNSLIDHNQFDGSGGCALIDSIGVFLTAHFYIQNNLFTNTCGFGITTSFSREGLIENNTFRQSLQQASVKSAPGQKNFVFAWKSSLPRIREVWVQVNGTPISEGVKVSYLDALHTMIDLPSSPTPGSTITALGWTALENIQISSQSWNMIVRSNTMDGTADSGIDVVSDYVMTKVGSPEPTDNCRRVFTFAHAAVPNPVVEIGGRVQTADQVATSYDSGAYTLNFSAPVPTGEAVTLNSFAIKDDTHPSVQKDFPGDVTIIKNSVKEAAAAGIAAEVSAHNITVRGNFIEDCGMGVRTPAYSTGIFTGGAFPILIRNNTIVNTRATPTMNSAISIQQVATDPGTIPKPVILASNVFRGIFPCGPLLVPALAGHVQSGIDLQDVNAVKYPEQPDVAKLATGTDISTRYFRYTCSGAASVSLVSDGGESATNIASGSDCIIYLMPETLLRNAILQVVFSARQISGTPVVRLFSTVQGASRHLDVQTVGHNWQQRSLYVSTIGMDLDSIHIQVDGTSGALRIRDIELEVKPINAVAH